jgi:hypothetical protein
VVTRCLGTLFAIWTAFAASAWATDASGAPGTPTSGGAAPNDHPVTSDAAPPPDASRSEEDDDLIRNLDLIETLDLLDTIDTLKAMGSTGTDEEAF